MKKVLALALIASAMTACQGGGISNPSSQSTTVNKTNQPPVLSEAKTSKPRGIEYAATGEIVMKHSYPEASMKCSMDRSAGFVEIYGKDDGVPPTPCTKDFVTKESSDISLSIPAAKIPAGEFSNVQIQWARPVEKYDFIGVNDPVMVQEVIQFFACDAEDVELDHALYSSKRVPSHCTATLSLKDNIITGVFECGQLDGHDGPWLMGSGFIGYSSESVKGSFGCKLEPKQ